MQAMVGHRGDKTTSLMDGTIVKALRRDPDDETYGAYAAITVEHPLSLLGATFLNGSHFAGNGDSYTIHVQSNGFSQSFHAVWDVGNWDAGGITLPQGESGQPGSGFYTDQAKAWVDGTLLALPYSNAAVKRAARKTLTLKP